MTVSAALAQRGPEIVVPGKPGVPVYINGVDASWAIIEGDFGLDRPDMASPTIVYRPYLPPPPARALGYYPADGRRPGYGRLEIVPPRHHPLPPPAPPYFHEWSSSSDPGPATDDPSRPLDAVAPALLQGLGGQDARPSGRPSARSGPKPAAENRRVQ